MTEEKRKRGRPKVGVRFPIQKHVFLDRETAALLRELARTANKSESEFIRDLIRAQNKST